MLSLSKGNKRIRFPARTFTGQAMTLTCGPPEFSVGEISGAIWKLNNRIIEGSPRIDTISSTTDSKLTVNNVVHADSGK